MKVSIKFRALMAVGAVSITSAQAADDFPVAAHEGRGRVLVTDSLDRGLTLLRTDGSDPIRITEGKNAGYGASISPDGRYVCYKGIKDSAGARLQAALLFDIGEKEIVNLSGWLPRVGTPSVSADGKIGFTIGRMLRILDSGLARSREVALEGAANLIGFSPDGRRVAYPDGEARIRAVDLADGKDILLTGEGRGFWGPAFSPDGAKLLAGTADGDVAVIPATPGGDIDFLSREFREPDAVPLNGIDGTDGTEGIGGIGGKNILSKPRPAYLRNPVWLDHKTIATLRVPADGGSGADRRFVSFDLDRKAGGRVLASAPLPAEDGNVLVGRTCLFRMHRRVLDRAPLDRASKAPSFPWNSVAPALPARLKPPLPASRDLGRFFRARPRWRSRPPPPRATR